MTTLKRITPSLKSKYKYLFNKNPLFLSSAPGRAEIIGNHTDYNHGYALGAAINDCTFAAVSPRNDDFIQAYSENFDGKISRFKLTQINKKSGNHWTNYVKAVVSELSRKQRIKSGFDLYVTSSVPSSGGVSSSAALELAVGLALSKLYKIKISRLDLAVLCQKAENGPLVGSPCGFLDQGTAALSKKNSLLFLDFKPKNNLPVSHYIHIPLDLRKYKCSFMIVVDKNVKRRLGESGYPVRRRQCEKSLPILSKLFDRKVRSLRDVKIPDFLKVKHKLEEIDPKMRMRVEHIVYENDRVLESVNAIRHKDIVSFGRLLTQSGESSLNLYELDEKTPELTFLVREAKKGRGVLGTRNMGGGFSANILVLIKNSFLKEFKEKLSFSYQKEYNNRLDFILFNPSAGARIVKAD